MTRIIVNTRDEGQDTGDGTISLRAAIEQANRTGGEVEISFSQELASTGFVYLMLRDGELDIATGVNLTINGDFNDDGIANLVLDAGNHHHFTVQSQAALTLTGVDLVRGSNPLGGALAERGADGADGEDGDFGYGTNTAGVDRSTVRANGGRAGERGEDGTDGMPGEDGADGAQAAGSIMNFGTVSLVRVGFGANGGLSQNGGSGGHGGDGGFAGGGGVGFPGNVLRVSGGDGVNAGTNGVISGGHGGDGGNGGNGAIGGDGGMGGSMAGAVFNHAGAILSMADVAFGGSLPSTFIYDGNRATGGLGGTPGNGGKGRDGGTGGRGGHSGVEEYWLADVTQTQGHLGPAGDGGNGGNGGNGASAGRYGNSGDAAGAVLNEGSILGTAAFHANTAGLRDPLGGVFLGSGAGMAGEGAPGGVGGDGNAIGDGFGGLAKFVPPGEPGLPGADGFPGSLGRQPGNPGTAEDDILFRNDGTGQVEQGATLIYAHLPAQDIVLSDGSASLSFNVIRLGNPGGDVTVGWEVRAGTGAAVITDSFGGVVHDAGTLTLEGFAGVDAWNTNARVEGSFMLPAAALANGGEGFTLVLTDAEGSSGAGGSAGDVVLGTAVLSRGPGDIGPLVPGPDGPGPGDGPLLSVTLQDTSGRRLDNAEITFRPATGNDTVVTSDNDGLAELQPGANGPGLLSVTRAHDVTTGDPAITASDALEVLRMAVGLNPSFGPAMPENYIAADINLDGRVDAADALEILRHAVGLPVQHAPAWLFIADDADLSSITAQNTRVETGLALDALAQAADMAMTGILLGSLTDIA